jgi:hypothetical protein
MPHSGTSRAGLAVCAGLISAAVTWAAPAQAGPVDDSFLSALDGAGINVGSPEDTVALGQSVCPMLAQSGSTLASAASEVTNATSSITGKGGMSPAMAELFTGIAVSLYCPQVMSSLANGQLPNLPQLPGVPGLPAGL